MNKKISSLFLALAAASAWAGPQARKPETVPLERNIAVDIYAPGAVRAEIAISIPGLEEAQRYQLQVAEGALAGGVYLPPGKENKISIVAFDARGEKLYAGGGYVAVDEKFTPQSDIRLEGKETRYPPIAKFGTYRLGLGIAAGPAEKGLILEATLFDALGNHLPFKPGDLRWTGVPDKFELLPYSCFRESLCIEIPDRVNADLLACWRDVTCSIPEPPDTRGPYAYVATGRTHTCALTVGGDIRCWGDNRRGQLRATPSTCPAGTSPWASNCSTVPLPIECGPGEVCKFQSLAAGGERTCAVDTAGKLWCWGSYPDPATGEPMPLSYSDRFNGEMEAFTANGSKVSFVSVDTDLRHSCAISTTRALYCWEFNQAPLSDQNVKNPGTQYRSVSAGRNHLCAVQQVSGKFECWGSNADGQLNGTYTGSPGVIHPGLQEILKRGGHRPAAGSTSTCAQDPNDNTICWGSPASTVAGTTQTGGWMALHYSYATSLASNIDTCAVSGGRLECTRMCATGLGGDLFCGNWKSWAAPTQLPMVPPPASDHYVSWNQMDVGPNNVCALNTQRDIWCFGTNEFGQFGTGTISTTRTDVPVTAVIH